ncbi:MAG TPA: alpha-L-fucosidase, partial [Puia sp.]|nr:alpha-L-fucosidase [Puia sp.]
MKIAFYSLLAFFCAGSPRAQGTIRSDRLRVAKVEPSPSTRPNKWQRAQIARKYGMFIHFGINTFCDEEWTDGTRPPSVYHPSGIDAEQWIATAKAAGMKYVILVTKHEDGF